MGHLNMCSLELINRTNGSRVASGGSIADGDVCAVGKSNQLAHPKKAKHSTIDALFVEEDVFVKMTPGCEIAGTSGVPLVMNL